MSITEWLDDNKLSQNVSKTHYIIFRSQGVRNPIVTHPLIIKDETVLRHQGVILAEKLTSADNILYIKGKTAKGLGIIFKARKLLNPHTLPTLYFCFVYPHVNYRIDVWGDTHKSDMEPLVKLQKKVLRIESSVTRVLMLMLTTCFRNYRLCRYKAYMYIMSH